MTRRAPCSLAAVLTATVVVVSAASLLGCASYGPATRVAVPDVKSLTGTWSGIVYRSGFEPESVALVIHEDGSYDVVLAGSSGTSRGRGKILVSDGRLLVEGEKGRGAGTLLRNPDGDLVLNVDMILNDNSTLTAKLWPSPPARASRAGEVRPTENGSLRKARGSRRPRGGRPLEVSIAFRVRRV